MKVSSPTKPKVVITKAPNISSRKLTLFRATILSFILHLFGIYALFTPQTRTQNHIPVQIYEIASIENPSREEPHSLETAKSEAAAHIFPKTSRSKNQLKTNIVDDLITPQKLETDSKPLKIIAGEILKLTDSLEKEDSQDNDPITIKEADELFKSVNKEKFLGNYQNSKPFPISGADGLFPPSKSLVSFALGSNGCSTGGCEKGTYLGVRDGRHIFIDEKGDCYKSYSLSLTRNCIPAIPADPELCK